MAQTNPINMEQFLKDNKIGDVSGYFTDREVTIEELAEFESNDLRQFCDDVGLDALQKNRFIKAINSLKSSTSSSAMEMSDTVNTENVVTTTQTAPKEVNLVAIEKKQSVGQDLKKASYLCGATICGIINIVLGIVAWILAIIASTVLSYPLAGIVALVAILIFLISNVISSIVSGICGNKCCSGCLLASAWSIFGICTIAAIADIYLSFDCWDYCTPERIAGGFIGTLYFVTTILFVVDGCRKATVNNDELLLDEN